MAEFGYDQFGGIGIDHVVDLQHLSLFHQELDDIDGALGHTVGQLLDGDSLGQLHQALDFDALILGAAQGLQFLALALASERGQAALFLLFVQCVGQRQTRAAWPLGDGFLDGSCTVGGLARGVPRLTRRSSSSPCGVRLLTTASPVCPRSGRPERYLRRGRGLVLPPGPGLLAKPGRADAAPPAPLGRADAPSATRTRRYPAPPGRAAPSRPEPRYPSRRAGAPCPGR